MIKNWIIMKKREIELKTRLYGLALDFLDEIENLIGLVKNLYTELKDVPMNELRSEFIKKLAEIIHSENNKNREDLEIE